MEPDSGSGNRGGKPAGHLHVEVNVNTCSLQVNRSHFCDNRLFILPLGELGASLINHSAERPADLVSVESICENNLLCILGEAVSGLQQGCDVCRLKAVLWQVFLVRLKLFPVG